MRLVRYEHAGMVLERDGARLVIDPGDHTRLLRDERNVAAVVLTHEHADHWADEQLDALRRHSPEARVFGPQGVVEAAHRHPVERVDAGAHLEIAGFRLEFFGGRHAVIHESLPVVDNVGVLVNGRFYYGGDSYAAPGVDVDVLAAPAGAPWLKIGEAMDYVLEVAPRRAFAVHDFTLSAEGLAMHRRRLAWATEQGGGSFETLEPGDEIEI